MTVPAPENDAARLQAWLASPQGRYILDWEEAHYSKLTADIFGFHALQIGFPGINTLAECRIQHRWRSLDQPHTPCTENALPEEETGNEPVAVTLFHRYEELPFASSSLDLVILPHVLEFSEHPHQILREVERVLIPEGQLIISGFNPSSLWGIRQAFGKVTGAHFLPQHAEFISLSRIKDWLKLLNLETNRGHFGCYSPPGDTGKRQARLSFLEKAGERWWPYLGAVYMLQAVKRVPGMRIIGQSFKKKTRQVFQNVPVNNRTINKKSGRNRH